MTCCAGFSAPELPIGLYSGVPLLEKAEVQRTNGLFTSLNLTIKADSPEHKPLCRQILLGLSCQVSNVVCVFIAMWFLGCSLPYSIMLFQKNVRSHRLM